MRTVGHPREARRGRLSSYRACASVCVLPSGYSGDMNDPTSRILSVASASIWALVATSAWVGYSLRSTRVELLLAVLSTAAATLSLSAVLATRRRAKALPPTGTPRTDGT